MVDESVLDELGTSYEDDRKIRAIRMILDASIDLATKRYAQMLLNLDEFDQEALDEHLATLKKAAQFPVFDSRKTVAEVPQAKGNFRW
jgi:hypothetical protein